MDDAGKVVGRPVRRRLANEAVQRLCGARWSGSVWTEDMVVWLRLRGLPILSNGPRGPNRGWKRRPAPKVPLRSRPTMGPMRLHPAFIAPLAVLVLSSCATAPAPRSAPGIEPGLSSQALAEIWNRERVSWPVPPLVRHADVEARLREVQASAPDFFSLEEIGRSVEGRSINHLWFGRGPYKVLLWSQMHGDEPTATAALFDVFEHEPPPGRAGRAPDARRADVSRRAHAEPRRC